MRSRFVAISLTVALLLSAFPIIAGVKPVEASLMGPTLIVRDSVNRINATQGVKAGSQITVKGTVTNIGPTPWNGLLTGVFFRENAPGLVPADLTFEWSLDDITYWPAGPKNVADPSSGYQVELIIGAGGYTLLPNQTSTTYVRVTANKDVGISTGIISDSVAVAVWQDHGTANHWDVPADWGWVLTQPPMYAGQIDWDNPIKLDLQIWHTAELDPVPPMFFYTVQGAINAASPGDTIFVYDGVYPEALYINSKSLTITAASNPVIKGSQLFAMAYGNREAVIFVQDAPQVILENLDIEGDGLGPVRNYGVLYQNSGGAIKNCIVSPNTIGDMGSLGVAAISGSDLVVESNLIKDFGRVGVYATNVANIYIHKNEIIGQSYSLDNLVNYGIEIEDFDGPSTAQIIGNKIYNSNNTHTAPLWSSAAIIIDVWRMYYDLTPSDVSMQCNEIYDNYLAIEVVSNPLLWAHYNNIYNNLYGVYVDPDLNNSNETFDARYNWWGTATGPYHPSLNPTGTGSEVGDYVDFVPWMPKMKVLPFVHDVAVTKVDPVPLTTTVGTLVTVKVTVKNEGNVFETVTVKAYYDAVLLGTETITDLAPSATKLLTFMWDSTGMIQYHEYIMSATADPVPGETDTADNTKTAGWPVIFGAEALIRVEPPSYRHVLFTGETFKINVTMNYLNVGWKAVGVNLRLGYDPTLIDLIEVIEGPFIKSVGDTFFWTWNMTSDVLYGPHVGVAIQLLPQSPGQWTAFPQGNGILVTFTFRVRMHLPGGSSGSLYCDLNLMDTTIVYDDIGEIPHRVENSYYENLPTNIGDINYDGLVDIKDLALAAKSFGAYLGSPGYNPAADVNKDGWCDIRDLARIAKNFGWRRS